MMNLLIKIVLIFYILFDAHDVYLPSAIIDFLSSSVGILSLILISMYSCFKLDSITCILVVIAMFELLNRNSNLFGLSSAVKKFIPNENTKFKQMNSFNTFDTTLEEEIVNKMVPLVKNKSNPKSNFEPHLDDKIGGTLL